MKNKNGFTLIELMAVITILVILSLIIIPIVDMNVKKSKNNMYDIQIENIRNAGMNYFSDNSSFQPTSGRYDFVTLDTLIENGYITDVVNPKTGEPFTFDIYIQVSNDDGKYTYNVCPMEEDCENYVEGGGRISSVKKVRDINPGVICGTGIEEDYENNDVCYIYSVEDLVEFSDMVNSGYSFQNKTVMLMNNLNINDSRSYFNSDINDFGDVNNNGEASDSLLEELSNQTTNGFPVIGSSTNPFSGTFVGNAHYISDLYISSSSNDTGFFGYNTGTIMGLILKNTNVTGTNSVGGFAGYNVGTIKSSRFDGSVSGTGSNVGGAVGYTDDGIVENIIVDAEVNGNECVGGVVGRTYSTTIKAIYRSGSVTGSSSVSRVVGNSSESSIISFALDSIEVNDETLNGDEIDSIVGFAVNSASMKSIPLYEEFMDTYIGGDNDGDGYYFDYDSSGNVELYSLDDRPLDFTLSGSGTESSPYIINNYSDLRQVSYRLGSSSNKVYYKLNSDIDMNNQNIIMLSSKVNQFNGTFDGNYKTISNFNLIGYEHIGLFGEVVGPVKDLTINNANVTAYGDCAGVVSGINYDTIHGVIINSSDINGKSYIGLVSGATSTHSDILDVSVNGNITGNTYIGLIVGNVDVSIVSGIASGNIVGVGNSSYIGGLVGYLYYSGLNGAYLSGSITYENCFGCNRGAGGNYFGDRNIIASDSIVVGNSTVSSSDIESLSGLSVSSVGMKNIAFYEKILDTYIGGDNDTSGYYYDFDSNGIIQLYSIINNPLNFTLQGAGTEASPYLINSYNDLKQISYKLDKYYKLNSDINCNNVLNYYMISSSNNPFTGTFDGNSRSISNLNIIGVDHVGLFGTNSGVIKNLSFINPSLSANGDFLGVVAGDNYGTIKGINITGANLFGASYIGLIDGYSGGSSNAIYVKVNGNITGNSKLGLLAGSTDGNAIVFGVASGDIIGVGNSSNIGGLVGNAYYSGVTGAYISGNIIYESCSWCNRVVGYRSYGSINAIALDTIKINGSTVSSSDTDSEDGKSYSSSDLATSTPYVTIGFDFTDTSKEYIWNMSNGVISFIKN